VEYFRPYLLGQRFRIKTGQTLGVGGEIKRDVGEDKSMEGDPGGV
jgi:hypothetical protein